MVPGRWQMACELIYNFVAELAFSNSGKKAQPFIPLFLSLFLYILFCNLLGLVPSSLTVTAHPVVNVGLAFDFVRCHYGNRIQIARRAFS